MAGIEEYSAMEDRLKNKLSNIKNGSSDPSAPSESLDDEAPTAPVDDQEPSAPALIQTFHSPECVVCLERKVSKQAPWFYSILSSRVICQKYNHIGTQLETTLFSSVKCTFFRAFNFNFKPQRVRVKIEIEMPFPLLHIYTRGNLLLKRKVIKVFNLKSI